MKKYLLHTITLCLLILASPLSQASNDHEQAKRLREAGDIVSLEIILQNARKMQPGKILEAELESKNGRLVYEIELLTPTGKTLELLFDAATGQHLSTEDED